jgi:hypothetical protein
VEHKCGACGMRERDGVIAEFSSDNLKEWDYSYGRCTGWRISLTGWRISLVVKLSFEEYGLMIWVSSAGPALTLNLLTSTIVAPPRNASKWQTGFNSAYPGEHRKGSVNWVYADKLCNCPLFKDCDVWR